MQFEREAQARHRLETEARRCLEIKGVLDPRRGGKCGFDEVRAYDAKLNEEIQKVIWATTPRK